MSVALLAIGVCVLVAWIVRRAANPRKLRLLNTPGRPNTIGPVHIVLVLGIWIAATSVAGAGFQGLLPEGAPELSLLSMGVGQVFWAVAGLAVAAFTFRSGLGGGLGLSLRHWMFDVLRGLVGLLAVLPVCYGLLALTRAFVPPDHIRQHVLLEALPRLSMGWKVLAVVSAVVLAPLSEEVFFRGLVQSMVRRYSRRPWVAIVVASAMFAAVHVQLWDTLPALFALGLVLGYNYERCGRLLAPMLIHALFNALTIFWNLAGA